MESVILPNNLPTNTNNAIGSSKATFLFWYPDFTQLDAMQLAELTDNTGKKDLNECLDGVRFHPLILNPKTFQPVVPYLLPFTPVGKSIVIPLFIRSEIPGTFNIRLKFEYIPNARATIPVTIEHEVRFVVQKPATMNVQITNNYEILNSVTPVPIPSTLNAGPVSTIIRGDKLTLSGHFTCLATSVPVYRPLSISIKSACIELLDISFHLKPSIIAESVPNENIANKLFSFKDHTHVVSTDREEYIALLNTLQSSNNNESFMRVHNNESIHVLCELVCSARKDDKLLQTRILNNHILASLGHLTVQWRLKDDNLFQSFDPMENHSYGNEVYYSPGSNGTLFPWLFPLGLVTGTANPIPVDTAITVNRKCQMSYTVPNLQVSLL